MPGVPRNRRCRADFAGQAHSGQGNLPTAGAGSGAFEHRYIRPWPYRPPRHLSLIHILCKDTADSGAIYTGRDWSTRGNVIRYNYFHDMEMIDTSTNMEMQAVYLDDMHSSTAVFGNVFYRVDSVALFGGGRDNTFENNLMLECKKPFVMDARGATWMETGERCV